MWISKVMTSCISFGDHCPKCKSSEGLQNLIPGPLGESQRPACLQIDKNVERELINHRSLLHPNIIKFKEVNRTSCTHTHNYMRHLQG